MTFFRTIAALFAGWAQQLAVAIVEGSERWVSPRLVRLVEQADGTFALYIGGVLEAMRVSYKDGRLDAGSAAALLRGSRVEMGLSPSHFLFRTLELPAQAADLLRGIVGAQIDRLTPWTASTAAFGCGAPKPIDDGRIATVVAVTTQAVTQSYFQAALAFEPRSVTISTSENAGAERINVFDEKARGLLNVARLSRLLLLLLVGSVAIAALSLAVGVVMADRLEARKEDVVRDIARIQTAIRGGGATPDRVALQALEKRKYERPIATIVLETLSQILPDNTYVTELHINGNRLQIVGISRDAPALIRLMEQSPKFTRATFFAPTTRSPSDPGDRFHLEARVEPFRTDK